MATVENQQAAIFVPFVKADEELGIIFGVINKADVEDDVGHTIPTRDLEKALYDYVEKSGRITDTHDGDIPGKIVAAWMFDDGNARVGFKPDDPEIFEKAKNGEYIGFSIGGFGRLIDG